MAGDRELRIRIIGDSSSGEAALNKTAKAAETVAPKAGLANSALNDVKSTLLGMVPGGTAAQSALDKVGAGAAETGGLLSGVLAGGAAAAGVAIAKMTADGVQQFLSLASETREYQRVAGGTSEQASQMVVAFREMGVATDTGATGMFKLSREVDSGNTALAKFGVEVAKNKDGTTDLNGTLLNVVDAYNATDDAAQKNAIAFAAFGRAGVSLLPILAKGRDGLHELWQAAADHGEIMSSADQQNAYDFKMALKGLTEAAQGLEIQMAKGLVPTLTNVAHGLTEVTDDANRLTGPFGGIQGAVDAATKSFQNFMPFSKSALDALHGDFGKIAGDLPIIGTGMDLVDGHFRQALGSMIPLLGEHKKATKDSADATTGLGDATTALGDATSGAADKMSALDTAMQTLNDQMADGKTKADAFKTAMDALTGAPVDAEQATVKFKDSVQSLGDALAQNGGVFDLNSGAGRKNISALDDVVAAAKDQLAAQVQNGATADQLTATLNQQRSSIINTLRYYGFVDSDIQGLLNSHGLTTQALGNLFNSAGAPSAAQVAASDFSTQRGGLAGPGSGGITVTPILQIDGRAFAQATVQYTADELAKLAKVRGLS